MVTVLPMLVCELVEGVRVWEVSDEEKAIGIFSKMPQLIVAHPLYKGAHVQSPQAGCWSPERSGLLLSNFYIKMYFVPICFGMVWYGVGIGSGALPPGCM